MIARRLLQAIPALLVTGALIVGAQLFAHAVLGSTLAPSSWQKNLSDTTIDAVVFLVVFPFLRRKLALSKNG